MIDRRDLIRSLFSGFAWSLGGGTATAGLGAASEDGESSGQTAGLTERVKAIVAGQLELDSSEVLPEARLLEDLGADTLDVARVVIALEEEFELDIPGGDAEKLMTVQDIVDYLRDRRSDRDSPIDPEARAALENRVRRIIVDRLDVEGSQVVPDARLVDDLDADSLEIVELIIALEDEFELEIPDEDAERLLTVRDVLDYLQEAKSGREAAATNAASRLRIRDAGAADLRRVAAITSRSWRTSHRRILPPETLRRGTPEFFARRWLELLEPEPENVSCVLLCRGAEVVGVGACGPYRRVASPPGSEVVGSLLSRHRYGELYRGYVDSGPGMRRHSELVFVACADRLLQQGFQRAGLWTNSANTRMRRFAASMGGARVASRPAVVLDRRIPGQREVFYTFDLTRRPHSPPPL